MFTRQQSASDINSLFEQLEVRRHLSSAVLSGGVLTVIGSQGNDEITVSLKAGSTTQLSVDMNGTVKNFNISAINSIVIGGRLGNDVIQVSNANGVVPFAVFTKGGSGKDTLIGGDFNDTLYGGDNNDVIEGGKGDDSLFGDDANDDISGGAGDDVIYGGAGNDSLLGDGGDDFIKGGMDNDRLSGGTGDDMLFGSEGDDSLMGDNDNDFLVGGIGDDDLDGGAGTDSLYGQLGNDDFVGSLDVSSEVKDKTTEDAGNNSLV